MSYQLSKNLGELLSRYQNSDSVDLGALAHQVRKLFRNQEVARSLLCQVSGIMPLGTLFRHLSDAIAHDSVVRDVMTTGHLAKLLSRIDVLSKLANPVVVGLPNSTFDHQSQTERAAFFEAGNILPIDAEILDQNAVKEMLERERKGVDSNK